MCSKSAHEVTRYAFVVNERPCSFLDPMNLTFSIGSTVLPVQGDARFNKIRIFDQDLGLLLRM
jgi:hypothetical protein